MRSLYFGAGAEMTTVRALGVSPSSVSDPSIVVVVSKVNKPDAAGEYQHSKIILLRASDGGAKYKAWHHRTDQLNEGYEVFRSSMVYLDENDKVYFTQLYQRTNI